MTMFITDTRPHNGQKIANSLLCRNAKRVECLAGWQPLGNMNGEIETKPNRQAMRHINKFYARVVKNEFVVPYVTIGFVKAAQKGSGLFCCFEHPLDVRKGQPVKPERERPGTSTDNILRLRGENPFIRSAIKLFDSSFAKRGMESNPVAGFVNRTSKLPTCDGANKSIFGYMAVTVTNAKQVGQIVRWLKIKVRANAVVSTFIGAINFMNRRAIRRGALKSFPAMITSPIMGFFKSGFLGIAVPALSGTAILQLPTIGTRNFFPGHVQIISQEVTNG